VAYTTRTQSAVQARQITREHTIDAELGHDRPYVHIHRPYVPH
jgi:hypothetical protein